MIGDAMNRPPASFDPASRRAGVRRTAWIVAAIAVGIYAAFVLSGVIGG